MTFDWAHMAATAVIIGLVVYLVNHSGKLDGASKGKKAVITAVAIFIPLFILNLIWPYGT